MEPSIDVYVRSAELVKVLNKSLLTIAESYLDNRIRFQPGPPPAAMVTALTSKQTEHMRTLLVLADHHNDHDILLVARAALEGMALLKWAMKDSENRCRSWRDFACVTELRKLNAFEMRGGKVSERDWERVKENLINHGGGFVRKTNFGVMDSERYAKKWAEYSASTIFKEVGAETYYEIVYQYASEWTHSSAYPIVTAVNDETPGFLLYQNAEPRFLMASLAAGFVSLFYTLEILQEQFHDQFSSHEREELAGMKAKFDQVDTGLGSIERT